MGIYGRERVCETVSVTGYACENDCMYAFTSPRGRMHVWLCTDHICMWTCMYVCVSSCAFPCLSVSERVFASFNVICE